MKKRIIPCLDIDNGRTVKGVNFVDIRDAGDPVELAARYAQQGADELVFLDITATIEARETLLDLVEEVGRQVNIPFTVGGGIRSVEDAGSVIRRGADKVAINSAAIKNPNLIREIADEYGSQCVVVAIDSREENGRHTVHIHGGRLDTGKDTLEWAQQAEDMGAGEFLLTSMDHDGVKSGFALELVELVCMNAGIPVIASGGAGTMEHFLSLFSETHASAGLAASIFHYGEVPIPKLKLFLKEHQIATR